MQVADLDLRMQEVEEGVYTGKASAAMRAIVAEKLVSVIVPVLNCGPWILEAINSCLDQTWPAIEVIVVDNGSVDDSLEAARSVRAANLHIAACETRGAAAARNVGLRLAQGDYFQFLDGDDVLHRDKIAVQMRRLADGPPTAMANGAWSRFRISTGEARFLREQVWQDLSPVEFLILSWLRSGGMMPLFSWLTPREVAEHAGPWDESLSFNDDGEYFTRALLASKSILFCEESRGFYRTTPGHSLSQRRDRQAAESGFRAASLSCQHLMAADSGPVAQSACATMMKRFAYWSYPDHGDLSDQADAMAEALGGSALPIEGGWTTSVAASLVGWRVAKRLQRMKQLLRAHC